MNKKPTEIEKQIIEAYQPGITSFRSLSRKFKITHATVRRILERNGVTVLDTTEAKYQNMAKGLRFDVSYKWLMQFEDFDKLKCLNECIRPRDYRMNVTTDMYMEYVNRFYTCENFNRIYMLWLKNDKHTLRKPSLDHIVPRSKTKNDELDNFQFLTWMENYCKSNLDQETWNHVKANLDEFFV